MEKNWRHIEAKRKVEDLEHSVRHTKGMIDFYNKGLLHFMIFYSIIIAIISCGISEVVYGTIMHGLIVAGLLIYGLYRGCLSGEYGKAMPPLQKTLKEQESDLEQARSTLKIYE
ncbi:MAG TPA: hypothetical protein VFQ47_09760 [Nitrososphaera sp.]|nr:hypothetical protein [Nitrososphaera sp.]